MASINKFVAPKPILVIRFPESFKIEEIWEMCRHWSRQMSDYHLIPLPGSDVSRIEFECLNPSNSPKELEELTESIKSNTEENKVKEKAEVKPL